MKFNQKQNETLEELYRTARIYTNFAARINEMADYIRLEDGGAGSEEYVSLLVATAVEHLKDLTKVYTRDLTKDTNDRLNDVKKAFQKTES